MPGDSAVPERNLAAVFASNQSHACQKDVRISLDFYKTDEADGPIDLFGVQLRDRFPGYFLEQ